MINRSLFCTAMFILVLGPLALATGCGGDDSAIGECPPNSVTRQQTGANILFTTCIGCHSSELSGAERQGAPVGQDFDDLDIVRSMADDIYRTGADGSMPPNGGLNENQAEDLRIYLACGADI